MHFPALRGEGQRLGRTGLSADAIATRLCVPTSTVRHWLRVAPTLTGCWRCEGMTLPASLMRTYGYLLGLYLGDGCFSRGPHGQAVIRIACANAWPGIMQEAAMALTSISPHRDFHVAG